MDKDRKFYLTKEGLDKVKQEYDDLRKIKQSKVGGRNDAPEVMHSEELNPDYLYFLEDLKFLENRINELDFVLKNSETIKSCNRKKDVVDVGATVMIQTGGRKDYLTIVETLEANPELGRISKESPVGRALLGAKKGDKIMVSTPIETTYEVKKINYHFS